MNFGQAVSSVLHNYANFSGRARRSEYWWFVLFNLLVSIVAGVLDVAIGVRVLQYVVALALLLPGLSVLVRRLHDIGKSGWWIFIGLIPLIGAIWLLVYACSDSQNGSNRFGQSPKYPGGGAAWPAPPAHA